MRGEDGAADVAAPVLLMIALIFGLGLWHELSKSEPLQTPAEDPFTLTVEAPPR